RGAMAVATIDFGGNQVDVAALHLGWPWPFEDRRQMPALEPALDMLAPRAPVGTDLNSAWLSRRARTVMALGVLGLAARGGPSWLHRRLPAALRPLIGLPIDHVLAKGGVITLDLRRGADVGSDHLPMIFDFALFPETEAPGVMTAGLTR